MIEHLRNIMDFHTSARSTLGVEWELQLIDKNSRDLRPSAQEVMAELANLPHETSMVHQEMLLNTVELVSKPRQAVRECMADIQAGVDMLEPIVQDLGIILASSGSHPFANPTEQIITPSPRYEKLVQRTQWWGRQMLIFGTHVHVGVEQRNKVLPLLRAMLTRFSHIQALSAASPYWNGELTGYADNRAMIFQQLPTAGIPQQFQTWEQLENYVDSLVRTGIVEQFNEIRWDIRPSPRNGTLEMRMCDAATNLFELGAVTALIQCLVEHYSRRIDDGDDLPTMPQWFVEENKWRAARYGVDAVLIVDESGREEPAKETLVDMIDSLEPVARDLDCLDELRGVARILELGAPYQRQIAVAAAARDEASAALRHHNHLDLGESKHNQRHPIARSHYYAMERIVDYMRAEMLAGVPLSPSCW